MSNLSIFMFGFDVPRPSFDVELASRCPCPGKAAVCEILLENQADVDHADKEGKSALFAAASMGHLDIVNLLLFWGTAKTQH